MAHAARRLGIEVTRIELIGVHVEIDVGTHVVHAPLRAYVMGERGADPHEVPTAEELATMSAAVREGMRAGAGP